MVDARNYLGDYLKPELIEEAKPWVIVDCVTGKKYSLQEAKEVSDEVRSRLVNKPRKIGCWVNKK